MVSTVFGGALGVTWAANKLHGNNTCRHVDKTDLTCIDFFGRKLGFFLIK